MEKNEAENKKGKHKPRPGHRRAFEAVYGREKAGVADAGSGKHRRFG